MNMNCLLSDAIARVKNAKRNDDLMVRSIPWSKKNFAIFKLLEKESIVKSVSVREEGIRKFIDLELFLDSFQEMRLESSPGVVRHVKRNEIPKYRNGFGLVLISTSHGVMTGEEARERGLGGKLVLSLV